MIAPRAIGIDLMGAETLPEVIFKAALDSIDSTSFSYTFFATNAVIQTLSHSFPIAKYPISFIPADAVIFMDDKPLEAVKKKTQASLVIAIKALQEKKIDALITLANTGAIVCGAKLYLDKRVKPSLMTTIESEKSETILLDVGAVAATSPETMVQNGVLGAFWAKKLFQAQLPTVGLLNIGKEPEKGGEFLRCVYQGLQEEAGDRFQFVGNVEPEDLLFGDLDVVLTDGFTGNIVVKTLEAVTKSAQKGALFVGLSDSIFKCHGKASPESIHKTLAWCKKIL